MVRGTDERAAIGNVGLIRNAVSVENRRGIGVVMISGAAVYGIDTSIAAIHAALRVFRHAKDFPNLLIEFQSAPAPFRAQRNDSLRAVLAYP